MESLPTIGRLRRLIAVILHLPLEEVQPEDSLASLQQRFPLDSLDLVEFTMAIEEEFGAEIDDRAAEELLQPDRSLQEIADWLDRLR